MDIEKIKRLITIGAVEITNHASVRFIQRNITISEVESAIINGEIIEEYPDDYPYPSCLVFGTGVAGRALHIVIGMTEQKVWIITAYVPKSDYWCDDYKTRKETDNG